jgi:hypothetical protein
MAALCQLNDLLGNAARASIPVEELEEIARENAELALQVINASAAPRPCGLCQLS